MYNSKMTLFINMHNYNGSSENFNTFKSNAKREELQRWLVVTMEHCVFTIIGSILETVMFNVMVFYHKGKTKKQQQKITKDLTLQKKCYRSKIYNV